MFIVQTFKIDRRQLPGNWSTHRSLLLKICNGLTLGLSSLSFLNSHLTYMVGTPSDIATVGDGGSSIRPRVHYTKMSSTRERRRSDPHDNSRDSSSLIFRPSVMVATPSFPCALQISSTRKRRRSDPHDNSRDSSSLIYIYGGHSPSLKDTQGAETDLKSTRSIYRAMT